MEKTNLSSKFLLPLVGANGKVVLQPQFQNSYLAAEGYDCEYGRCLFLKYSSDLDETSSNTLKSLPTYVDTLSNAKEADLVLVYKVDEESYEKVVKPFIDGKYSAVDREYVERFFPRNPSSPLWRNRLVFDKDSRMLTYWKNRGVDVPEGAEVFDKPLQEKETYDGYKDKDIELAVPTPDVLE